MTQPDTLQQALADAQQAIADFDFADGLSVTASVKDGALALTASGHRKSFEYRASGQDLRDEGSSWFIRRALRSLNDRFEAGHLGDQPDHEFLRPPDKYPLG